MPKFNLVHLSFLLQMKIFFDLQRGHSIADVILFPINMHLGFAYFTGNLCKVALTWLLFFAIKFWQEKGNEKVKRAYSNL